jgi:spore coat protein U-like protein
MTSPNKIVCLAGLIIAGLLPARFHAQTAENDFTVQVTLAGVCEASNANAQTVNFGVYTAYQAAAQNSNEIELQFRCTRGLMPVSVAFDSGTGRGVLQGLNYALTASSVPVTQAGDSATADSIGSADTVSYRVSGTMPANQAGSCPDTTCGPAAHVRTLVLTY